MFFSPGEYIKKHRKKEKLTQKKLAQKISVTQELISLWENDRKRPGYENVKLLSSVLKVPLDELAEIMGYSKYYDYQKISLEKEDNIPAKKQEDINEIYSFIPETIRKFDEIMKKIESLENKIKYGVPDRKVVNSEPKKSIAKEDSLSSVEPGIIGISSDDSIKLIPVLEGRAACGFPSVITEDATDEYLPFPSAFFIPADFIIKARGNSMIEEGITDGMLCFIKRHYLCNSGDIVLLNIRETEDANLVIKKAKTVQNIMVFQDGKGNILEIPEGVRVEIIGKVIYKADDPRKFS